MRQVLLFLTLLSLSGCGASAGVVLAGGTLATYVNTDKLPSDHITSFATGEDCDTGRLIDGGTYCMQPTDQELEFMRAAEEHPFCYQTLGDVTCYDTPDPYNENSLPIR